MFIGGEGMDIGHGGRQVCGRGGMGLIEGRGRGAGRCEGGNRRGW